MSAVLRTLQGLRPLMKLLPEVQSPDRKAVPLRDKTLWTIGVTFSYLFMSMMPLFGAVRTNAADPMFWMRGVTASSHNTLLEFGVTPLLASQFLLDFLILTGLLRLDVSVKEERKLVSGGKKLFTIAITVAQALLAVFSGAFGDTEDITPAIAGLLVFQLLVASIALLYLDELVEKGYAFSSAPLLFVALSVSESVFSQTLSFKTVQTLKGKEYEGAFTGLITLFFQRKNKFFALKEAMFRPHLPNVLKLATTAAIAAGTIYVQMFRTDIPITSTRARNVSHNYPVRLFLTGATPGLVLYTGLYYVYFLSQALFRLFPENIIVRLIGVWKSYDKIPGQYAASGLVYYIFAPHSVLSALDPIRLAIYTVLSVVVCGYAAKIWLETCEDSPSEVARMMALQQIVIRGRREGSMKKELYKILPTNAIVGGCLVGLMTVAADIIGGLGSGSGIVLAVLITQTLFVTIVKEQQQTGESLI